LRISCKKNFQTWLKQQQQKTINEETKKISETHGAQTQG
jgi:hypothetical protein